MTIAKLMNDTAAEVFATRPLLSPPAIPTTLPAGTPVCELHYRDDVSVFSGRVRLEGEWRMARFGALPETHGGDATRAFSSLSWQERAAEGQDTSDPDVDPCGDA